MPQPSLSHHLRVLVAAGILERERRGTWSWYTVVAQPLEPRKHCSARAARRQIGRRRSKPPAAATAAEGYDRFSEVDMRLTVLHVPGCPSVPLLTQRMRDVLPELPETAELTFRVISDEDEAIEHHMNGSPTLLIDGIDRLAEPDTAPSISCRLYRDEDGRAAGVPSVVSLRRILGVTRA